RTPEQEFWDEPAEPVTPPPLPVPEPGREPQSSAPAERGRKRLLGRRKAKRAAAAGAAAAAASAASDAPAGPTTGETQAAAGFPTGEEPFDAGPPTAEQPVPPPTGEQVTPEPQGPPTGEQSTAAAPPTGEEPIVDAGPPTAEQALPEPIPPETEAPHALAAEVPQADPGPGTAETPQLDPNQPRREQAPPPVPVEQTGAGDWEPPPPRDDWGFDEDDDFHEDGDPNMAGAARTGRRHGEGGNRGGGFLGALLRHPFRILATVVLILILVFLNSLFQPFVGEGHGKVVVDIPKGSSVGEVGDLLEKEGVISDGFVVSGSTLFQARVTIAGKRSDLFAGKFTMKEGMSYGDAIDELSKEPKPAQQATKPGIVTVTIPEGQSRPITAKLVKEDGVKGNYLKASKKSKLLNPEKYGGKNVKNLEGFLFPDTWEFKTNKPVKDLVALQLQDFKKQIKKVNMKYAKSKNLTVYDVVTIASIIEREAAVPKQRKLVASVIYNRLHEGMTLGMDSTIRFATGNYEKPLTESELESSSPYNTRNHAGLPPGPINSPGLAAINAAAHPAKTEFLFFVNNPNSCNELAFAKTEEEFLANEAKYQKAREKNGGNEPSTCK
ncbi:MAG TPA: endolytic transglycosylase MltG, partial [Solirubrobacterales bacterium]|nr:endolytic transglycosylase MltG [Solirubrobacterales bacterium]